MNEKTIKELTDHNKRRDEYLEDGKLLKPILKDSSRSRLPLSSDDENTRAN